MKVTTVCNCLLVIFQLCTITAAIEDCPCDRLEQPDLWEKERTARWMVHSIDYGVLSTISSRLPGSVPFGNVYSFVDGTCRASTGTPYFYGTFLDQTFIDSKHNPKASLTLTEASLTGCGDKMIHACDIQRFGDAENPVCARLTLTGTLMVVNQTTQEYHTAQTALFQRHPQMTYWPADHKWVIAKLQIEDIWLIDYFGGATILDLDRYYAVDLFSTRDDV